MYLKNWKITFFGEGEKVIKKEIVKSESRYSMKRIAKVKAAQVEGNENYSFEEIKNEKK